MCRFGWHYLDQQLNVICDLIPAIQRSIFAGFVRNQEQVQDLRFFDAHTTSEFRKSLIRIVPSFMNYVGVEIFLLLLKKSSGIRKELIRCQPKDCSSGLMDQSRRRVPRLDLLAKDELYFARVLLLYGGKNLTVYSLEHLGRKGAHIVEI